MRKSISPGILWVLFLVMSLAVLIRKYQANKTGIFSFSAGYAFILIAFFVCSIYTYIFDIGKSRASSLASFFFGLTFWIPLLNLIFAIPAVYFGFNSLKKIRRSHKYGGKWFAIVGIVLGLTACSTYLIGVGMCIYGYKDICKNIGLAFLSR